MLNTFRVCPQCGGTGIYNRGGQIIDPCPCCQGNKFFCECLIDVTEFETICNDFVDKFNDILDKCNNIREKCDEIKEELS